MESLKEVIFDLVNSHPGRWNTINTLATLLDTTCPPCIHIHSPFSARAATKLIRSIADSTHTSYASVHGVECLSSRLFFDRALIALAGWHVQWDQGCESYGSGKYSSDLDGFIEGLRAIARERPAGEKMVLIIERAEKFKDNLPELMVPLTRLAELSGLPITIIFISDVSWFDLRPPYGAGIDPFLVEVLSLEKQDAISTLVSQFPVRDTPCINPYLPSLKPLYSHFASTLHSVCSPFLVDETELAYIAAACWPGFVSPLLADWRAQASIDADSEHDRDEDTMNQDPPNFLLPDEEARMRLMRYFTPSYTRALEKLYPREQHANQWTRENAPPLDLRLSELLSHTEQNTRNRGVHGWEGRPELTTVAKYILVAAFLASFNPAKTDERLLGRTPDERKKRRGGGPRRPRGGGKAKVPQRLLGPAAFPLDRLLAIVGSLMEENDEEVPTLDGTNRRGDEDEDEDEREKDTEMAIGRIQVSATISELVAMRLLHRTTPVDRLDGPPSFKCGIPQARAFEFARELGISTLADFMWDPN